MTGLWIMIYGDSRPNLLSPPLYPGYSPTPALSFLSDVRFRILTFTKNKHDCNSKYQRITANTILSIWRQFKNYNESIMLSSGGDHRCKSVNVSQYCTIINQPVDRIIENWRFCNFLFAFCYDLNYYILPFYLQKFWWKKYLRTN